MSSTFGKEWASRISLLEWKEGSHYNTYHEIVADLVLDVIRER